MQQPVYLLFAGINGAGKTTLYHTGIWNTDEMYAEMPRVNSDEILRSQGGRWDNNLDQIRTGREAIALARDYLIRRISFNRETTLAGKSIVRSVYHALDLGYEIVVHYVGVDNPDIASARVQSREKLGGHGIDAAVIERRWTQSLGNLERIRDLCASLVLYDNTTMLSPVARFTLGELRRVYERRDGAWYLPFI